jgi:hypothetical protein
MTSMSTNPNQCRPNWVIQQIPAGINQPLPASLLSEKARVDLDDPPRDLVLRSRGLVANPLDGMTTELLPTLSRHASRN